ncbi:MAG: asparagine synthase (glutamine-hydrolyzing) [Bacteroidales bacterium]|nr:asparagine synthase (glutamine-hydrolyzing) [Bacteroidales bacterium]HOY39417.1 asparagine synthase (glutamine-hydrolyzing) [Bacteroidales bacterium]HQP04371.1 asparagine synthase (glutamine-hydrolyzing) [Bacteroidales bacterium]
MCGIAGIVNFNKKVLETDVRRMCDTLIHRGPDAAGVWINHSSDVGFGHRRLSIIDLSAAANQPMHYSGKFTITFNGEIFNYIELREELTKKGMQFRTDSDTEVLLAAYEVYGENMLQHLDGQFAFAIYDNRNESVFCARDRIGEKPFYYYYDEDKGFYFASEMKAIFAAGIPCDVNQSMVYNYLLHWTLENPFNKAETFYKNIFSLEPASMLILNRHGLKKRMYWQLNPNYTNHKISFQDAMQEYRFLFGESVRCRQRSDVPVGTSLSGGIDSSSVVREMNSQLKDGTGQFCFSARFEEAGYDEGGFMSLATQGLNNVEWRQIFIDENDYWNNLQKIAYHQEEPFLGPSVFVLWQVQKLAHDNGIVVLLDGQGADEILAGYFKYFNTFLRETLFTRPLNFRNAKNNIFQKTGYQSGITALLTERMRNSASRTSFKGKRIKQLEDKGVLVDTNAAANALQNPFTAFSKLNEALCFDVCFYGLGKLLRFADRSSMAFSREIRLPFLSHKLIEFVFSLPADFKIHDGYTKYIHRKSMESVLPSEICWRTDKMSPQAPYDKWLNSSRGKEMVQHYRHLLIESGCFSKDINISNFEIIDLGAFFENARALASHQN